MQSAISLKSASSAAVQMQAQLSNLIAIQNLQEYLKYLILTTSIEPQAMKVSEKPAEDLTDKSSPLKQEDDAMVVEDEESEIIVHDKKEIAPHSNSLSSYLSSRRKKSQKLFSLMQKRYDGPKVSSQCEETERTKPQAQEKPKSIVPMIKKTFKEKQVVCGHPWRDHYAKGLCGTCYLKFGRTKKPWNCSHEKLYALGLCQKCYAAKYNMKKKSCEPEDACNQIKTETLGANTCQDHVLMKETMEQEKVQTFVKIESQY